MYAHSKYFPPKTTTTAAIVREKKKYPSIELSLETPFNFDVLSSEFSQFANGNVIFSTQNIFHIDYTHRISFLDNIFSVCFHHI
jgi:hypothetical protein